VPSLRQHAHSGDHNRRSGHRGGRRRHRPEREARSAQPGRGRAGLLPFRRGSRPAREPVRRASVVRRLRQV